jgi:serine/threonine protein kinase
MTGLARPPAGLWGSVCSPRLGASSSTMSGFAAPTSRRPTVDQVYELGKVLGKGSFSTVYQGIHKQTREEVSARGCRGKMGMDMDMAAVRAPSVVA